MFIAFYRLEVGRVQKGYLFLANHLQYGCNQRNNYKLFLMDYFLNLILKARGHKNENFRVCGFLFLSAFVFPYY